MGGTLGHAKWHPLHPKWDVIQDHSSTVYVMPRLSVPQSLNDTQVYSMATVASEHFKPVPRSVEEATRFIHCLGLCTYILLNEVECNEAGHEYEHWTRPSS